MPPKTTEADSTSSFMFERDRIIRKNEANYVTRQKIMEMSVKVPLKPPQDPSKKLKERLATYHNVQKMRTDYKNYVRKYGKPSFSVPLEILST